MPFWSNICLGRLSECLLEVSRRCSKARSADLPTVCDRACGASGRCEGQAASDKSHPTLWAPR